MNYVGLSLTNVTKTSFGRSCLEYSKGNIILLETNIDLRLVVEEDSDLDVP